MSILNESSCKESPNFFQKVTKIVNYKFPVNKNLEKTSAFRIFYILHILAVGGYGPFYFGLVNNFSQ